MPHLAALNTPSGRPDLTAGGAFPMFRAKQAADSAGEGTGIGR
jgi:hypothetical protein